MYSNKATYSNHISYSSKTSFAVAMPMAPMVMGSSAHELQLRYFTAVISLTATVYLATSSIRSGNGTYHDKLYIAMVVCCT